MAIATRAVRLRPRRIGRLLLAEQARLRIWLEVGYDPRRGRARVVTRPLTLRKQACRRMDQARSRQRAA